MTFDSLAFGYDAFMAFWRLARPREALAFTGGAAGLRVVDLCGGTGLYARAFAPACDSILVLDRSAAMLAKVPKAPNLSTLVADARDTGLKDASFDLALLCDALHHVGDGDALFAEAARILRPGGRLFVLDFVPGSAVSRLLLAFERALFGPLAYVDPATAMERAGKAGFSRLRAESRGRYYFLLMERR